MNSAPTLVERDNDVIANAQKLRFSPASTVSGSGSFLYEEDGRELIDLSACWGATGLGNAVPEVVAAVTEAIAKGAGGSNLSAVSPYAVILAEELRAMTPGDQPKKVLFGHAGTDANEAALQLARDFTNRPKVLAFEQSYHGGFGEAKEASGMMSSSSESVTFIRFPRTAADIDEIIDEVNRELATGTIAAVILEAVQCDGGVHPAPSGFLSRLEEACGQTGTLLVLDEVKTGLGRSGNVFTFEEENLNPDIITFGKALGNGMAISAVVGRADVMDSSTASCILTTAGNPASAAAGSAVVKMIQQEELLQNVRARSAQFFDEFPRQMAEHGERASSAVVDVRGKGLNIGVDLVDPADPQSSGAAHAFTKRVILRLYQLGALAFYVADTIVEITPPLTITQDQMTDGIRLLAEAISDVSEGWDDPKLTATYQGW